MKRIAFFALAAAVAVVLAASPAEAAKRHRHARAVAPPPVTNTNEAGGRLFRDGLVIFLPSWSMPIYMAASGRTW